MQVKVADLTHERRFEFELLPQDVYEAIGRRPDVRPGLRTQVAVDAELVDRTVNLVGEIRVWAGAVCGRCAEEFDAHFALGWRIFLAPVRERPGPRVEDLDFGYYTGDRVNLERHALDGVALLFPEFLLCRPDCRGICLGCRANLNTETCRCPGAPDKH